MAEPTTVEPQREHLPLALLVDPHEDTRSMYAAYLDGSICAVDEAEDGREALAKAIARRPGVIVTETQLPGIDGFALCRLLRRDQATAAIPVVFLTADAVDRDLRKAYASGAAAVLVKPCLPERLADEIRRVLATSADLRVHSDELREKADQQLARADALLQRSRATVRRVIASRTFLRSTTTEPPEPPPAIVCPTCDRPLRFTNSYVGGVSARYPEQWDYFECSAGCGTFQFRHRTRKLRRVT